MSKQVEMLNIYKSFGELIANNNVSITVNKGEVYSLLGENGAGKSTLMSILFGLYKADKGVIKINGQEVEINSPNDANKLGIGMVHQHFKLVDTFTILENIILGGEDTKYGILQYDDSRKKILDLIKKYHLEVDIDELVKNTTVAQQQRVEILKMLYRNSDILIFDEPTAVLTPTEIDQLMISIRSFAQEGKTVILITHKLKEIKQVADRCAVLRRGELVNTVDVKQTSIEQMAEMMVGRKVFLKVNKPDKKFGEVVFKATDLVLKGENKNAVDHVSFEIKKGEIVGIAGIDGNGQSELIQGITGLTNFTEGKLELNGKDMTRASIRQRYNFGLSHIPEDRQKYGLVLDYPLSSNLIIQDYYKSTYHKYGFLKFDKIDNYAKELIDKFDIRTAAGSKSVARQMSGGNQQKAIIAREISKNHNFLVAMQPTRGLDVGAIEYIYSKLIEERNSDKAVLLVSMEIDEIMDLSDRILVMYEGRIVAELNPKEIDIKTLGFYMAGGKA
jgi:simple sugar transport system ATP-binding protein